MVKWGRRNIALLTCAPTGTTSLMTQTTSGIEPVFLPAYKRRRKVNPNDKDVKVAFIDEVGDSWEEYNVFHHKFITWLDVNGYNKDDIQAYDDEKLQVVVEKSPYYKATSNDVDWVAKVKLQGEIQKYIDHSISVTINVPATATEDLVEQIYLQAWKSGCKGVTIYRDGSRSGVLIGKDKKENKEIAKTNAPKRPKILDCDIHYTTAVGKKWVVLVGKIKNDPYEVFAFAEKNITISKKITTGKLVKEKSGVYNLEIENGELRDICSLFESGEEESLTRMISTGLRHGVDIKYIVDQLKKSEGNVVSFSKAIYRTLNKYVPESADLDDKKCPNCGNEKGLQMSEGCVKCVECSWSKCG
jgi:ribonucleoside-diphosphate reductase alpha chain